MDDTVQTGWEGIFEPGEEVLWQGRPDGALDFRSIVSVQSVFALFFTGFSLFWMVMAFSITSGMNDMIGKGIGAIFPLFGVPFLLIGLNMLVGRFWADARRRRSTYYTLSTKAAYIGVETGGKRSLDRYAIDATSRLTLSDGDLGSVWFASSQHQRPVVIAKPRSSLQRRNAAGASTVQIGFERIAEARKVYGLMRQMQIEAANAKENTDA